MELKSLLYLVIVQTTEGRFEGQKKVLDYLEKNCSDLKIEECTKDGFSMFPLLHSIHTDLLRQIIYIILNVLYF